MRRRRANAVGQPLRRFVALCDAAFGKMLARHGFLPTEKRVERNLDFAKRTYGAGKRYVEISGNTHFRDAPACCQVTLGEGNTNWPECDWNSLALWQLAGPDRPAPTQDPFELRDVADLPMMFRKMRRALARDAADFLAGDLRRFRRARARWVVLREPYKIGEVGTDGKYVWRYESKSAALRAKYAGKRLLAAAARKAAAAARPEPPAQPDRRRKRP
jgi:hypothetical protein